MDMYHSIKRTLYFIIIKYVVSVVFYIPAPHRPIDHGRAATARGVLVIESMGNKGVIDDIGNVGSQCLFVVR